ncbi:hypothetical protein [Symmachiella dynata]|nr:hypothetical protein [Symmachiella dynata]|tara:strand:+ start:3159 stop:3626 length:468 start_codon:yes stop_codon:yes gene_type:complete
MMMFLRKDILLLLSAMLLLAGCGYDKEISKEEIAKQAGVEVDELKETVPVTGTVTVDGTPTGNVYMYAYTEASGVKPVAQTKTKADGTYCWTKYLPCDGMLPGEYRLAFKHIVEEGKGKEEGPDLFEGKYRNPNKNDFKLSVQSGSPQVDVNYEL